MMTYLPVLRAHLTNRNTFIGAENISIKFIIRLKSQLTSQTL